MFVCLGDIIASVAIPQHTSVHYLQEPDYHPHRACIQLSCFPIFIGVILDRRMVKSFGSAVASQVSRLSRLSLWWVTSSPCPPTPDLSAHLPISLSTLRVICSCFYRLFALGIVTGCALTFVHIGAFLNHSSLGRHQRHPCFRRPRRIGGHGVECHRYCAKSQHWVLLDAGQLFGQCCVCACHRVLLLWTAPRRIPRDDDADYVHVYHICLGIGYAQTHKSNGILGLGLYVLQ